MKDVFFFRQRTSLLEAEPASVCFKKITIFLLQEKSQYSLKELCVKAEVCYHIYIYLQFFKTDCGKNR